jgi:16S rRNA (uracil1498-N3)-methyltransferase
VGQILDLSAEGARHVQVLRLQPNDGLTLFGDPLNGGEYDATVLRMGRSSVTVQVIAHHPIEREAARLVHLVVGMPANERMDWLVEKATELGVTSIQPIMTERTVLRLKGERAEKKQAHWQAVAIAACEQCGGNRVPVVHPVHTLTEWLQQSVPPASALTAVLSLSCGTQAWSSTAQINPQQPIWLVHGPEGGLTPAEEQTLLAQGYVPVALGPRVLRAETAAIAALVMAHA